MIICPEKGNAAPDGEGGVQVAEATTKERNNSELRCYPYLSTNIKSFFAPSHLPQTSSPLSTTFLCASALLSKVNSFFLFL